mgnify:CR=1 FL=1
MKFRFKIQQYQTDAVNSVVSVFKGQPYSDGVSYRRDLGEVKPGAEQVSLFDTGYLNEALQLTDEQLLKNIRDVQQDNDIYQSASLAKGLGRCALDVEMETGTGKTYVYIKTMFELNKRYGWSKFIVVVPSIAIREGVYKSFQVTQGHFAEEYGKKIRFFIYNSAQLTEIDRFASDSAINVMIINSQAFNAKGKDARRIYMKLDEFRSRRPIDIIAKTNPILIIDEPQSVEGKQTKERLKEFHPLLTLRYSATHKADSIYNMVYRLDAMEAYNKRLVKKIAVKGITESGSTATEGFVYLESINLSKADPTATIQFDCKGASGIRKKTATVGIGYNLYDNSGNLDEYKVGFVVKSIDGRDNSVEFLNGVKIFAGDVIGKVSEDQLRRIQIRETILSHLERERQLFHKGIKVLSLFFIDEVAKYKQYDEVGHPFNGIYADMFEEEYNDILSSMQREIGDEDYIRYLDAISAHDTHAGYFSVDKKGKMTDSKLSDKKEGTSDDIDAYDLIMKNKELLLDRDPKKSPVRFIFSHSALREGWDNPNVFQICTLKHSDSTTQKRQEVGRGLRLCVNQAGERMDAETVGADVHVLNTLTVIASEGYAEFVKALQEETKAVLYDRPRKATVEYFEGKNVLMSDGSKVKLDEKQAKTIWKYLAKNDYIDEDDGITQEYRNDAASGRLQPLPETLQPMSEGIHKLIQAIFDDKVLDDMVKDGNKTPAPENPLNDRFYKKEFQTLWNTINHKYAYTVDFDGNELIKKSIAHINSELFVSQLQYTVSAAGQKEQITGDDMRAGDSFGKVATHTETLKHASTSQLKYDLVGKVAEGTVLTRRTAAAILMGIAPDKFYMYRNNPEEFISKVIRLIKEQKATMIVEHITYDQIEGSYDSSIFTAEKHGKTLDQAFHADKAIQDYVFTDGTAEDSVERRFAQSLDGSQDVFIYAKLPKGFAIPTPVGHYSPDWAIVFHEGAVRHIYFIAETKGTMDSLNLRPIEKAKIDCAKKLFTTLSNGMVTYDHVDDFQQLLNKVMA